MTKSCIECFLLEPTDRARVGLRRFAARTSCAVSGRGIHDAEAIIGECGAEEASTLGDSEYRDDPRWPKACACGYVFESGDSWQVFRSRLFKRSVDEFYTLFDAPPGAMWFASWYSWESKATDRKHLMVQTPAGTWSVDGESTNGNGWTRTGDPPKVTVHPSILIRGQGGEYHGWLRDGVLVEV